MILTGVANLSEEDADVLEAAVTNLEERLRRLWPLWSEELELETATDAGTITSHTI